MIVRMSDAAKLFMSRIVSQYVTMCLCVFVPQFENSYVNAQISQTTSHAIAYDRQGDAGP